VTIELHSQGKEVRRGKYCTSVWTHSHSSSSVWFWLTSELFLKTKYR